MPHGVGNLEVCLHFYYYYLFGRNFSVKSISRKIFVKIISLNLYAIFFPAIDDEVENINMAFPTPAKIARDETGITV